MMSAIALDIDGLRDGLAEPVGHLAQDGAVLQHDVQGLDAILRDVYPAASTPASCQSDCVPSLRLLKSL